MDVSKLLYFVRSHSYMAGSFAIVNLFQFNCKSIDKYFEPNKCLTLNPHYKLT